MHPQMLNPAIEQQFTPEQQQERQTTMHLLSEPTIDMSEDVIIHRYKLRNKIVERSSFYRGVMQNGNNW